MSGQESHNQKVQQICILLEEETLKPAKQEAKHLIEKAQEDARKIIEAGEIEAKTIIKKAEEQNEKNKKAFLNNLKQAASQTKEKLKEDLENTLFNLSLVSWIDQHLANESLATDLGKALVESVQKEGIQSDLSLIIGSKLDKKQLIAALGEKILSMLREKDLVIGDFSAGVQLKLHKENLILDISDTALSDLLERYLRKEFRDILFS